MGSRPLSALVIFTGLLFLAAGCGGGVGGSGASPVKVSGTIYLDDQPLEGAQIVFVPDGGGQQANGISGSGGKYRLTTRNIGDGAVPGKYKVTVKKSGASGDSPMDPGSEEYIKKMKEMQARGKPGGIAKPKTEGGVHTNYNDAAKTPLILEVPSGGSSSLDLKLTSAGN